MAAVLGIEPSPAVLETAALTVTLHRMVRRRGFEPRTLWILSPLPLPIGLPAHMGWGLRLPSGRVGGVFPGDESFAAFGCTD